MKALSTFVKVTLLTFASFLQVNQALAHDCSFESSYCSESESNDHKKSANWMPVFEWDGSHYTSVINGYVGSNSDQDWFVFKTVNGGTYTVVVGGFDGNKAEISKSNGDKLKAYTTNGKCEQTFTLNANETYYIKISYTKVASPMPYSIRIEADEQAYTESSCDWMPDMLNKKSERSEPVLEVIDNPCLTMTATCWEDEAGGNNNQKAADWMPSFLQDAITFIYSSTIQGLLSNGKDQDWFKFRTTTGGLYTVTVCGLDGFRTDITKSNGTKLNAYSSNGKFIQLFNLEANQTYYVKVSYTKVTAPDDYMVNISSLDNAYGEGCLMSGLIPGTLNNGAQGTEWKAEFKVWPNPSTSGFRTINQFGGEANMRVYDMNGRTIEMFRQLDPGATLEFGKSYRPGVYMIEINAGGKKQMTKLVKQ